MNYQEEARKIYDNYHAKRIINNPFQDAVIDFLYLLVCVMIANHGQNKKAK